MKLRHKTDPYCTHQPVLIEVLKDWRDIRILELGSGAGSTELLHLLSEKYGNYLLTVDHDNEWLDKYQSRWPKHMNHEFKLIQLPDILKDKDVTETKWDLIFMDQGEWMSRYETLLFFKDKAKCIIIHDSYYYPLNNIFGKIVTPIVLNESPAKVDYTDVFKWSQNFWPNKPWAQEYGPDTLIGSNHAPFEFWPDFGAEEIDL